METATIKQNSTNDVKTSLEKFNQIKKEINDLEKKLEIPEEEWLINQKKYAYCLDMIDKGAVPDYIKYITGTLTEYKTNLMAKLEDIPQK